MIINYTDEISQLYIRNGTTGDVVSVNDKAEILGILSPFSEFEFNKEDKLVPKSGWYIILDVHYISNNYDRYILRPDGDIEYNGYLYCCTRDTSQLVSTLMNYFS